MTDDDQRVGDADEIDAAVRRHLARPDTWEDPPAAMEDLVVAAIAGHHDVGGSVRPLAGVPTTTPRRATWVLAAAAAVVLFVVGVVVVLGDGTSTSEAFALSGTELAPQASGSVHVYPTPAGVKIVLEVDRLPAAPRGTYYQGWLRSADDSVSVGTFHLRGGDGPIELWSGIDDPAFHTLSITLQDEGGGPASSGRVVLRGDVTPAP